MPGLGVSYTGMPPTNVGGSSLGGISPTSGFGSTALAPWQSPGSTPWQNPNVSHTPSPQQAYPAAITQAGVDYDKLMGMLTSSAQSAQPNPSLMQGFGNIASSQAPSTSGLSSLMAQYQALLGQGTPAPTSFTPYTPQQLNYTPSADVTGAMGILQGLATTGGLSAEAQGDIRARDISPVRAVYANAMRDLSRNRALQGGYSPNYAAASSRMAREESDRVAGATTNANANIAQLVQQGQLAAAPQYAQMASGQQAAQMGVASQNQAAGLTAAGLNQQGQLGTAQLNQAATQAALQARLAALSGMSGLTSAGMTSTGQHTSQQLGALQGMTSLSGMSADQQARALQGILSLYGTTPGLANMFGNQVLGQSALQQQGGLGLIGSMGHA